MTRVIYLHGFASGPASNKARFFRNKFEECGVPIEVPDLADGDFERLTITGQLEVIRRVAASQPVTLVGSSMGGYLGALYAARHPEVERLVLLAPAFGFGRRWPEKLGEAAMEEWRTTGTRMVFHYGDAGVRRLSYRLIEDSQGYEDFPKVSQPVLILHGLEDEVVPAAVSEEFARGRQNVRIVLLPSGHELTDVTGELWEQTAGFLGLESASQAQV